MVFLMSDVYLDLNIIRAMLEHQFPLTEPQGKCKHIQGNHGLRPEPDFYGENTSQEKFWNLLETWKLETFRCFREARLYAQTQSIPTFGRMETNFTLDLVAHHGNQLPFGS